MKPLKQRIAGRLRRDFRHLSRQIAEKSNRLWRYIHPIAHTGAWRSPIDIRQYVHELTLLEAALAESPHSDTAVIVHLFHPEIWDEFTKRLQCLNHTDYDLFISLPPNQEKFRRSILKSFPSATVVIFPNRGRDVLPFTMISPILRKSGYTRVLKIHSKISAPDWTQRILGTLLPDNPDHLANILEALNDPQTGVIGSGATFIPVGAAALRDMPLVVRLCRRFTQPLHPLRNREYLERCGYFAGTMFWVRLDALDPLMDIGFWSFDPEARQKNGTTAHALERMFTLTPRINGRINYEISTEGILARSTEFPRIPDWFLGQFDPSDAAFLAQRYGVRASF